MKKLKTITLAPDSDDNTDGTPSFSLCVGHITAKDFKRAAKAEGWSGGIQDITDDELKYEYWVKVRNGWRKSTPGRKGAKAITVMTW